MYRIKSILKTISKIIFGITIILSVIFIPAGTFNWIEAWIFLSAYLLLVMVSLIWLKKHDPELFKERSLRKKEGKLWDKVLLSIYTIFILMMFITCGLDAVRFKWTKVPLFIKLIGFIGFIPVTIIIYKVFKENRFASKVVRIQNDRSHKVIKTGPYKYIRHPMYLAIMLSMILIPLALGSFFALIFSFLIIIVYIIRTYFEDTTLKKELPGYTSYTKEVRYRLFPGIW